MTEDEINAEIKRLRELKKSQRRPAGGRPALTGDELVEREMARLRAKAEAKKRFAAEQLSEEHRARSKLPDRRGIWLRKTDGKQVSCSEHATCIEWRDGQLVGPTMRVHELHGEWEYVGPQPDVTPRATRAHEEALEHMAATHEYTLRVKALAKDGKKPCGNYRCNAELPLIAAARFCKQCEEMLNLGGRNG